MSTITLQNFRVGSDLTVKVRLKDGGVAIDWSTLSGIRAVLYSDAQSSIAGRCDVTVDGEDPTLLVCRYAATKMQYLGVNRIVVSAKYMGVTKTYDKPAFTFVRWSEDQAGEEITVEDPEVTVEIDVEDVSSSILQEAVDAAFSAADRANEAAEAAEHMVDIQTGPAGKSPYKGENGNWFEWDEESGQYVDTGVRAKGEDGVPGTTPHIGQNGNWFIGDVDTGVAAGGQNGVTPHIGQNGNWFIGDTDTGVLARGTNGVTPHIGDNGHWFIGETDTGILAEGTDGATPHIGQNGHWYIGDVDTGVIAEGHDGEDGVGFDDASTPEVTDGTFIITLSNGNKIIVDLNHEHPQYYSKLVETSQPQGGFLPDVIYKLGTITGSVTFALAAAVTGNASHYFIVFDTGSAAPTITWPAGLTWVDGSAPAPSANKHCEVSIMDGIAAYLEV